MNRLFVKLLMPIVFSLACFNTPVDAQVAAKVNADIQPKLVKIFGSGGFANLHAYQTGAYYQQSGKIVTVWSHVLEGKIIVYDYTGRRHNARFVGFDPVTELALLKIEVAQNDFFDLKKVVRPVAGMKVSAFCNLFGIATKNESHSVMTGVVAAVTTLDTKLGQFNTPYNGPIVLLDLITNNPGASGGVVVDHKGRLVGLIGKELKDRKTGLWLNFCIPFDVVAKSIQKIESGSTDSVRQMTKVASPLQLTDLGIELVPDVIEATQPYIDRVIKDTSAEDAKLKPDDLIVFVGGRAVRSIQNVNAALASVDRGEKVDIIIRRDEKLMTFRFSLNEGWQPSTSHSTPLKRSDDE